MFNDHCSSDKGVGVGLHFGLLGFSKAGSPVVDVHPPLLLLAHFALVALAGQTNDVSALVASYFLPMNFFTADPATKLFLFLLNLQVPQLFQSQLMGAAGAVDDFEFLFYLVQAGWGVFESPEGCLHVLVFFGVEFVDAGGFNVFVGQNFWLRLFCSLQALGD